MSDNAWGPTMQGGSRSGGRGLLRRLVIGLLVLLMLLLTFGVGTAYYASTRIERVDVSGLDPQLLGAINFLIVGNDSREDLTPEERQELTTGSEETNRTDTIMLLSVGWRSSAMLSFPRDLVVTRCDGTTGRINAAVAIGGPGCLVETITTLSGIPISNYVEIDFLGFRDVVNALGGVEVCLDQPIADDDAGIDLPAGCQVLDGTQALGYVRVRKIDDDIGRIQRQQQFLRALAAEMVQPTTLLNPVRVVRTAEQAGDALTGDERLGMVDLLRLGMGLQRMAAGRSATFTVPNVRRPDGATLGVDDEQALPLFRSFQDGSILAEVRSGTVEPEDVTVDVLNATGVSGLAANTADALEDRGFEVRQVGNTAPRADSVILHPPGEEDAGRVLAREIPVAVGVEESGEVRRVTLVLGEDGSEGLRLDENGQDS